MWFDITLGFYGLKMAVNGCGLILETWVDAADFVAVFWAAQFWRIFE